MGDEEPPEQGKIDKQKSRVTAGIVSRPNPGSCRMARMRRMWGKAAARSLIASKNAESV